MRGVAFILRVVIAISFCTAGVALAAAPAATEPTARSLVDWYAMGGALMHGIALCSVLIVGTVLERGFALRRSATLPSRLARDMKRALAVGNLSELKRLSENEASALERLAARALDPEASTESIETAGVYEAHRLSQNLPLLAALGNLATMIGLLGTVLGMLDAFDRIAVVGSGDARVVAGGIFLALITTAAGMATSIVAVASHAVLTRRASAFVAELESMTGEIRAAIETYRGVGQIDFESARARRG